MTKLILCRGVSYKCNNLGQHNYNSPNKKLMDIQDINLVL